MSIGRRIVLFALITFASTGLREAACADADSSTVVSFSIARVRVLPGDQDIDIEVHIDTYFDSVAGFELWFQLDRPGVAEFILKADVSASLIHNWEYLDVRSMTGGPLDCKVTGLADITPPILNRGFGPQQGGRLFTLQATLPENPDPYADSVAIHLVPNLENFGLSTPTGHSIGIGHYPGYDTSYYRCEHWEGDSCLSWVEVAEPPYDTFFVLPAEIPYVDTVAVQLGEGYIVIGEPVCGDIDGSVDELVTMADLTVLIDHLFMSYAPIAHAELANVDGSPDGQITVGDMTQLIDHLFISYGPLDCWPR